MWSYVNENYTIDWIIFRRKREILFISCLRELISATTTRWITDMNHEWCEKFPTCLSSSIRELFFFHQVSLLEFSIFLLNSASKSWNYKTEVMSGIRSVRFAGEILHLLWITTSNVGIHNQQIIYYNLAFSVMRFIYYIKFIISKSFCEHLNFNWSNVAATCAWIPYWDSQDLREITRLIVDLVRSSKPWWQISNCWNCCFTVYWYSTSVCLIKHQMEYLIKRSSKRINGNRQEKEVYLADQMLRDN